MQIQGRPALLHVLFEHQRAPDPLMPYRLLGYTVRIWERSLEQAKGSRVLPVVIPLVLTHGEAAWSGPARLSELLDVEPAARPALVEHTPELVPLLLDLSGISDDELRGTALGRLALYLFKHIDAPVLIEVLVPWAAVFGEAMASSGLRAMHLAMEYILNAGREVDPEHLWTIFREIPVLQEVVMSTADRLRQEARQEAQRRSQRRLLRLLDLRFGEVPANVCERVDAADDEQLDLWTERILTAATIEEVV